MPTEPSPSLEAARPAPIAGGGLGKAIVVGLSACLVALVALVVLGRFDRAPAVWLTGLLFVLPYLFLTHLTLVFAAWCVLPDRKGLPILLALVSLGMAGIWGPSLASWREHAAGTDLRVMSWNLRRLWGGVDDGGDARACAIEAIAEVEPDVLTLLEVSRANIADLERALDMRCVHATYNTGGGEQHGGLAVCARGDARLVGGGGQRFVDDEDWHYVLAEVEREGRRLNALAVHLTPYRLGLAELEHTRRTAEGQANQSAALLERVGRFEDPTLMGGDFNSTPDFALHASLRGMLVDTWERGGIGPGATKLAMDWLPLRIDYIYASEDFAVRDASVLPDGCSDHYPVVTDLTLRAR